ncbi:hypothetical protein HELRODRAFT_192167 [Helobdella robusta]|uniref:Uncharacterized protein n=1 Tax=Helobdella robusta TaxID=6412 RepID=T1FTN3_HELRO|nr:hypothetical protein HELRODRAFT_192167 [Helobdella robusta]ESO02939.1 hypothetical protein HELRODRAFT_192167 [Helobdella robusta]
MTNYAVVFFVSKLITKKLLRNFTIITFVKSQEEKNRKSNNYRKDCREKRSRLKTNNIREVFVSPHFNSYKVLKIGFCGGECVIALKSGFDASPQLVEAELVYLGQSAGTLKCSLHIIVKDETNMQAFAKRRKPSVDLIYIDADFLQKHLNNRSTTSCIYADFLPPTQPNQPNKTSANVHKLHQGVHSFDSENKTKPPVLPRRKKT